MLNNNDKKTSFLQLILMKYGGTPLIRSPMGQKHLAVLIGWPYWQGFFLQENVWSFSQAAKKSGRNNEVMLLWRP